VGERADGGGPHARRAVVERLRQRRVDPRVDEMRQLLDRGPTHPLVGVVAERQHRLDTPS
jgi:hypothetical protein